jgi:dihydrofolate synthase/folylpolyglutamate synthase
VTEKQNAQARIQGFQKFGSKLGLERMEALCAALGHPEERLRVIHVAGTNGKGSVCRYVYEVLRAHGRRAGIFTSPYIGDFRERIEADGELISVADLERLTARVAEAAEALTRETGDSPTEFEIVTTIGLAWFAEQNLDFVVLEVGLGGRGDSTNIVKNPLVCVITQIALDHTERLGETEEEIAAEKAGIIKPGRPVVSGAEGGAARVIARRAYALKAPYIDATKTPYHIKKRILGGYIFDAVINGRHYDDIELSMTGAHQVRNALTALCALECLRAEKLLAMDGEALHRGMKAARLDARFQIHSADPLVIFDGAHNPNGARALVDALQELLPKKHILFVPAILRDKAADEMIAIFAEAAAAFISTRSANDRSLTAEELAEKIRAAGGKLIAEENLAEDAYNKAMSQAHDYDAVVFAGSLYMIGELTGEERA